jgi:hypothetical protein
VQSADAAGSDNTNLNSLIPAHILFTLHREIAEHLYTPFAATMHLFGHWQYGEFWGTVTHNRAGATLVVALDGYVDSSEG